MLYKINNFVQKYFFKIRIIFETTNTNEKELSDYKIIEIDRSVVNEYKKFFQKNINEKVLINRLKNEDCRGFLAIHLETKVPVGFEWCIMSKNKEYRHDNFLVPIGYGLLFNAYVIESHRGKGVFQALKIKATKHLIENEKSNCVLSVVELLNAPSIKGNKKIGSYPIGRNYLVKILKRNFFSISKIKNHKINIDYVLTGEKNIRI